MFLTPISWCFRTKVKTVTFLLPVDDIYTSRPVLKKHQEEPKITELAPISETDSWAQDPFKIVEWALDVDHETKRTNGLH